MMTIIGQGISGALFSALLFYALASLVSGRLLRLDSYRLLLYMTAGFLMAVICEVGFGLLYARVTGEPLWQYRIWPIHEGFTSTLNLIIWPVYGYYLYLLTEVLATHRIELGKRWYHGLLSGFDGPFLEILANGFFLLFYSTFYFYYFPGDLRHFSSVQVIPFYMVGGVLLTLVIRWFNTLPRSWIYPTACYGIGCLFILIG